MSASARARGGLGLVPEGVAGLFPTLTVRENLDAVQVYAEAKDPDGWAHVEAEMRALFATVLEDRSGQVAGSMSGGQRQMLAIALALTRRPSVLLLDEPSTGLGPAIVAKANSVNLKLLSVDDQFIGADGQPMKNVHHLGISAGKIGENVGQILAGEMKRRGWTTADTALCAVTFEELATAKERTEGAINALLAAGLPANRIFKAPERTADIPGSFDATNVLLTQQSAVKHWLVCSTNDNGVLGAVRALEGRGFGADSAVGIGINGTDCITELEKNKPTAFYGSILLSAKSHGYQTTEMLYHWIKDGIEPPLDTRTVGVLITRDNFRQILKEQGVRN